MNKTFIFGLGLTLISILLAIVVKNIPSIILWSGISIGIFLMILCRASYLIKFLTKKKTIGILNEGKNCKFINNKFTGLDIGIHDKGEGTTARGNKFTQQQNGQKWYRTWWGQILIGLIVLIIGTLILKYIFHI